MEKNDLYTDLATEKNAGSESDIDGVKSESYSENGFSITKISVKTEEASRVIGKPCGNYTSIEDFSEERLDESVSLIAKVILDFTGKNCKNVLVCGLGNRNITPDALGARTVDKINVTRVIGRVAGVKTKTDVSAISPGVLGITGIETAEILSGVCEKVKPDAVIVVDSLCARDIHRIASTVQFTDTGIHPGGGLKNYRNAITSQTLGRKVISIGVPTVVYAKTICHNVLELLMRGQDEYNENAVDKVMSDIGDNVLSELVVTPKDIDMQIENISSAIASGINRAFGTEDLF